MAANSAKGLLTSVDDLFTTQAEREDALCEKVVTIPTEQIIDFPGHPFKVVMDENMREMVESVQQYGVLVPALVRPDADGQYLMVSGHRRKMACELAGKPLPCIVRNMTDDEAILAMVDSNLQRESILPSEKAFAYKMKLSAMRRQAGRPSSKNVSPVATNYPAGRADMELAEQVGESKDQIRRYIRLTYLLPELLFMVDNSILKEKDAKQIAMRPAVELSYLTVAEQRSLLDTMSEEDCTPSHAQAIKMRSFSKEGKLTKEVILSIMQEEKPNQKEQVKISKERISRFFAPGTPVQKMEETIVKALEMYRKRQREKER